MLALARVFVRYVRFLTPDVVSAIVEDNTRRAKEWRALLAELRVDPTSICGTDRPAHFQESGATLHTRGRNTESRAFGSPIA